MRKRWYCGGLLRHVLKVYDVHFLLRQAPTNDCTEECKICGILCNGNDMEQLVASSSPSETGSAGLLLLLAILCRGISSLIGTLELLPVSEISARIHAIACRKISVRRNCIRLATTITCRDRALQIQAPRQTTRKVERMRFCECPQHSIPALGANA